MYEKISKAQQKAVQKYVAKNYDRFVVTVPKGERDKIKSAAALADMSVNSYIVSAIHDKMKKDNAVMLN